MCCLSKEPDSYTSAALPINQGKVTFLAQILLFTHPEHKLYELLHSLWYHLEHLSHQIESMDPYPPQWHQIKNQSPLCWEHTKYLNYLSGLQQKVSPLKGVSLGGFMRRWVMRLSSCLSSSPGVRKALQESVYWLNFGRMMQLRCEQLVQPLILQERPGHWSQLQLTHRLPFFTCFRGRLPSTMKARVRYEPSLVLSDDRAHSTCIHSSLPTFLSIPFSLSPPQTEQLSLASFTLAVYLHSSHLNLVLPFSSNQGWQQLRWQVAEQEEQVILARASPSKFLRWHTWQTTYF